MDMIGHQMALLDPAFPPPGQVVEHGAKVLLDFPEDRFLPVLRYENIARGICFKGLLEVAADRDLFITVTQVTR